MEPARRPRCPRRFRSHRVTLVWGRFGSGMVQLCARGERVCSRPGPASQGRQRDARCARGRRAKPQ
eukprot:6917499-Lingulodinium_polyedra.AAC.1